MECSSGGGFPLIESAAADTTCTAGGHYQATPTSPSSSSSDDHSEVSLGRRRQVTSDPDDPGTLPTKRRRMTSDLDDSASFMFPHHMKQPLSSPSSIMHPSGRMLPVGIAQPMQSLELDLRDPQPVADWEGKPRPLWKDEGEGEESESEPLETKPDHQATEGGGDVDEEVAVQEVLSQLNADLSSSDSAPSSDDDSEGGMEPNQHHPANQYQNETESLGRASAEPNRTPLFHEVSGTQLPPEKKHHVFLSHSTGDQAAVKNSIVVPLRECRGIKVVACYHCMEHGLQYNDKFIERAMSESCVIVVGLSPSYLESQRCQKEWRRACDLVEGEEGAGYQVVVAALGRCSRPDQLRSFLYLDFIDRDKRDHVLQKLVQTIDSVVGGASEVAMESPTDQCDRRGGDETEAAAADDERGSLLLGPLGGCDMTDRRLEEEFEAAYSSEAFDDHQFPKELEREMGQGDPRTADVTKGGAEAKEGERKRSEEVEEGEVSDSSTEETKDSAATTSVAGQSEQVAKFYNELAQPDADNRDESPIFFMRNFNNWVKSVLIRSYIQPQITVLDLCCGKGGDLLKWKEGGIGYLVCTDISESSVEACQGRYASPRMASRGTGRRPFEAEFHVADCCGVRLRDRYSNSGRSFNIVSCQFSVHYAFETYSHAHMMLRNACENLRPGGFFIGTTIDSNEIVRRLREADQRREDGSWFIGNEVFSVTLDPSLDPRERLPLFGAKYNFKLHGVVDLPEYLVHFPLFEEMLKDFDMEVIFYQNFTHFFSERRYDSHNANLMFKMQAFDRRTATMPPALWEVIGLYLVYVFRKRDRVTHSYQT